MTKHKYLTISEGYSAAEARPIIATSDENVIRAAAREISKRLGADIHQTQSPKQVSEVDRG